MSLGRSDEMNVSTVPLYQHNATEIIAAKKALEAVRAYFDDPDVKRRYEAWKAAKNA